MRLAILGLIVFVSMVTNAQAFIPQNVRSIAVLEFSGPERSGKETSFLLAKALQNENEFFLQSTSSLEEFWAEHPELATRPYHPDTLKKIGTLLQVDAVVMGHVLVFDLDEKVTTTGLAPAIQATVSVRMEWGVYDTRRGEALVTDEITIEKTDPDPFYQTLRSYERASLFSAALLESVRAILEKIKSEKNPRPVPLFTRPLSLSAPAELIRHKPFKYNWAKTYSGLVAPELATTEFDRGDKLWINTQLAQFKQIDTGEVWVSQDVVVLDGYGNIVFRKDRLLDYRTLKEDGLEPLNSSLRIDLPAYCAKGTYRIRLRATDWTLLESAEKEIAIKLK